MLDVANPPNENKVETYAEFATHTVEAVSALNDKAFTPETFIKTKLIDDGKIVLYSDGKEADASTYEKVFNILKQNFQALAPDVKDVKERTSQISVNKDFVSNYGVVTNVDGYLQTSKSIMAENIYPYSQHEFYGIVPPLPSKDNDITEKPVYGKIYQTADVEIFGSCYVYGDLTAPLTIDLETRLKSAEDSLQTDEKTIQNHETRITALEQGGGGEEEELEERVAKLEKDVAADEKTIESQGTRITTAETTIENHETRITALEQGGGGGGEEEELEERVAKLEKDVAADEQTIQDHETRITALEQGGGGGGGEEEELEERVAKLEKDVAADEETLTDHGTRLTTAETTLTDHGTRLTTAEGKIEDHGTRLTTAEGKIEDHETRITTLEQGGGGDSYWQINTELVAAKTETITPVSELWINPNNLIWSGDKDSFYISDLFLIKYNDVNYTCRYICYNKLHHKTKEIYGIVDAVSYKGLRVHFETRFNHELDWSLADNNTMNTQAMLVVHSSETEQYYDYIDINVNEVLPLYIGNHRYGIGFIVGHAPDAPADVDFYINGRIFPLSSVSIAGIEPGDDENEPFQDYTPEETVTSISSIYPVKNNFVMDGPNMLSLTDYLYNKVSINLDDIVETKGDDYIRISFSNFTKTTLSDCSYTGIIMTYYLPSTKFVSAGGYSYEKLCIYRIRTDQNTYKYKTDALILENGHWTTSVLDINEIEFCFDLSLSDDYSPRNMFELGLSRIVIEIHPETLTTDKTIICDEVVANNCFQYQPSSIPNFSMPKEIGEEVVSLSSVVQDEYDDYPEESKTMWYIDFGYEPNSDEFKQLGLGQEFRFIDEVAKYEFRAKVAENESGERYWDFDNGTIPYPMPLEISYKNICEDDEYNIKDRYFVFKFRWNFDNAASIYRSYISTNNDTQYLTDINLSDNTFRTQCLTSFGNAFSAGLDASNISKCSIMYALYIDYQGTKTKYYEDTEIANVSGFWSSFLNVLTSYELNGDYYEFPAWGNGSSYYNYTKPVGEWFLTNYGDINWNILQVPQSDFVNYLIKVELSTPFQDEMDSFMFAICLTRSMAGSQQHPELIYSYSFGSNLLIEKFRSIGSYRPTLTFSKDSEDNVIKKLSFSNRQGLKFYIDPDHLEDVSEEVKQQWDMTSNLFSFLFKTGRYKIYPLPENTTALYTDKNIITDKIVVGRNIESFLYSLNEVGNQVADSLVDISNLTQAVRDLTEKVDAIIAKVSSSGKSGVWGTILGALGLAAGVAGVLQSLGVFSKIGWGLAKCCCSRSTYYRMRGGRMFEMIMTDLDAMEAEEYGEDLDFYYVNEVSPLAPLPQLQDEDEWVSVPWYLQNASSEGYELIRQYVDPDGETYEDVESERTVNRYKIGDSLPLFDYDYVGRGLKEVVYDTRSHFRHRCYIEIRSAIRNVIECGVTDFFNKFEQTPPRSAIIQTPENIEFRVDSITFDNKNIKGFADKNNESTWTSDKLVDADFVKDRFNKLETNKKYV